jgi:D-arginine dehydrogenase
MDRSKHYQVIIVGAGIAGASLAYFLAQTGVTNVLVLEREGAFSQHATGRSAAALVSLDRNETIQRLKVLGGRFLQSPPAGFSEEPVLQRTGVLMVSDRQMLRSTMRAAAQLQEQDVALSVLSPSEAQTLHPALRASELESVIFTPNDGSIHVPRLFASYMNHAQKAGIEFRCHAEVQGILRHGERCCGVKTANGDLHADWVVNAAGAWAGQLAELAAAIPIRMRALRRCAVTFDTSSETTSWPLVWSDPHHVYFKREGAGVLFSPMDEVLVDPLDPRPDDSTLAAGFERLGRLAPGVAIGKLSRSWAGMRTFSPDRVPVVGEDPVRKGFFWLAGQGGCGIETSPALGRLAAELLSSGRGPTQTEAVLSPGRFEKAA